MADDSSGFGLYAMVVIVTVMAIGAIILWSRTRKSSARPQSVYANRHRPKNAKSDHDGESFDAAKELEWFRKTTRTAVTPEAKTKIPPLSSPGLDRRKRSRMPEIETDIVGLDDLAKIYRGELNAMAAFSNGAVTMSNPMLAMSLGAKLRNLLSKVAAPSP